MVKNFFLLSALSIMIYFFIKSSDNDEFNISITKHPDLIISKFSAIQINDKKVISLLSAENMVRDKDFDVRLLAAKLTVHLERTDAINDLKAAVQNESIVENKKKMQVQLQLLENLLGKN